MALILLSLLLLRLGLQQLAGSAGLSFWIGVDGEQYLRIAQYGYQPGITTAFLPLYSLVTRLVNLLTANYLLAALLVSHLAAIGFGYFFVKLANLDLESKKIRQAWAWLLLFPSTFFLFAAYSESLFLMLAAATFYFARQKQLVKAAFFTALASITSWFGILLLPAILWEWYQTAKKPNLIKTIGLSLLSSSGLLTHLYFLKNQFNLWPAFIYAEPGFGTFRPVEQLVMIYQVMARYGKMFLTINPSNAIYPVLMLEFITAVTALSLILFGWYKKRLRGSYLIYLLPTLLLPILSGSFGSIPRLFLSLFPLFLILPELKLSKLQLPLMIISGLFAIWTFIRFSQGFWVT
jgi:Gpi18-like mannosyltransferase